jgi:predicted dinucleotide-binding enzyme
LLIDVANPLDFSQGMPPTLGVCNTDSLGEQIQRAFPETKVVKALTTIALQTGDFNVKPVR